MPKVEEDNICRLFLLLVHVATDVLKKLFKVVALKGDSFEDYLKINKHSLYHLHKNTFCCQCVETCKTTSSSRPIRNKGIFSNEQFFLLFKSNKTKVKSHMKKNSTCICDLNPMQKISVDVLDVTLIYHLLKHQEALQKSTEHWLDTIKRTRNTIVHLSDLKKLSNLEFQSHWQNLEGALRGIASTISPDYEIQTASMVYSIRKQEINDIDNIEKNQLIQDWFLEYMTEKQNLQEEAYTKLDGSLRGVEDRLSSRMENMQRTLETVLGRVSVEMNTNILISKNDDEVEKVSCFLRNKGIMTIPVLLLIETPEHWNKTKLLRVMHTMTSSANEDMNMKWCDSVELKILMEMTTKALLNDDHLKKEIHVFLSKLLDKADVDTSQKTKLNVLIKTTDLLKQDHNHCNECVKFNCNYKGSILQSCEFIDCTNGCNAKLHMCKLADHKRVCRKEVIQCLNDTCREILERSKLSVHLRLFCSVMPCPRQHNGKCDECFSNIICDKDINYRIKDNLFPCPNGCQLKILIWELDEHKESCQQQKIPCVNRENGCSEILKRSKMAIHLSVCPSMPSAKQHSGKCPECLSSFICNEGKNYGKEEKLMSCPNRCQMNIHTWEFDEHMEICAEQKISCINKENGCSLFLRRSDMSIHLSGCPSMPSAKQHIGKCSNCSSTFNRGISYGIQENLFPCPNGCQLKTHSWELDEHMEICPEQNIYCLNKENGCSEILIRSQMAVHLSRCPSMPSAKQHSGKCPDCLSTLICNRDKKYSKIVNAKPCLNGCKMNIQPWEIEDHNDICSEQKIPCYNREGGCLQILKRSEMKIHLSVCPSMEKPKQHCGECPDCDSDFVCYKVIQNTEGEGVMPCPNRCKLIIQTWNLEEHLLICPEQKIPCFNSGNGCPQILKRSLMAVHIPVCPAMPNLDEHSSELECPEYATNLLSKQGIAYAIRENFVPCPFGCQLNILSRRLNEHEKNCSEKKIPCFNRENGCQQILSRSQMAIHLPICPLMPEKDLIDFSDTD